MSHYDRVTSAVKNLFLAEPGRVRTAREVLSLVPESGDSVRTCLRRLAKSKFLRRPYHGSYVMSGSKVTSMLTVSCPVCSTHRLVRSRRIESHSVTHKTWTVDGSNQMIDIEVRCVGSGSWVRIV